MEFCSDVAGPKLSNEMIALQDSSQRNLCLEHKDNVLEDNVCQSSFYIFMLQIVTEKLCDI